jgi:hypothetical protein
VLVFVGEKRFIGFIVGAFFADFNVVLLSPSLQIRLKMLLILLGVLVLHLIILVLLFVSTAANVS